MHKYLLGSDTFLRHKCILYLTEMEGVKTVLDVGGDGLMAKFAKKRKVVTLNIDKGDIIASGLFLPFKGSAFDAVTSSDILEHIPGDQRWRFIEELLRVAGKKVIICAPLGTREHTEYEISLYYQSGIDVETRQYIYEHIKNGLPTPVEIGRLVDRYNGQVLYQGDYRKVRWCKNRIVKYAGDIILNIITVLFGAKHFLKKEYNRFTNRFYLCIDVNQNKVE